MAHRFYMDVHVPSAVTEGLRRRGLDPLTSQEDNTQKLDDVALLAMCADDNELRNRVVYLPLR